MPPAATNPPVAAIILAAGKGTRMKSSLPKVMHRIAGRSIGEMAWHLAEIDACLIYGVSTMHFAYTDPVPHLEKRPKEVSQLAPAFARVHAKSLELFAGVSPDKLDATIRFSDGRDMTVRDVLWLEILHHTIHHRAFLCSYLRLNDIPVPALYGPSGDETG